MPPCEGKQTPEGHPFAGIPLGLGMLFPCRSRILDRTEPMDENVFWGHEAFLLPFKRISVSVRMNGRERGFAA